MAAGLHVITTVSIFLIGRSNTRQKWFDMHGTALSFAPDVINYRNEAITLSQIFLHDSVKAWITAPPQLHVKLYSLSFAAVGNVAGYNIVALEPLNILYYLLTLFLIFRLGQEIFDTRIGLASAIVVALWPSFLLHSTQILRDPLSTAALLVMVLLISRFLTRDLSWREGLIAGAAASASIVVLWIARIDMWVATEAIVLLGAILVVARQIVTRRLLWGNVLGATLLLFSTLNVPWVSSRVDNAIRSPETAQKDLPLMVQPLPLWVRIAGRRRASTGLGQTNVNSNVDVDVNFEGLGDIVRYLPRAATIGLFAPFPTMWFDVGTRVGLAGRLLAGAEMVFTYVFELGMCLCLWQFRRRLAVWLLFLIALIGSIGLGLVVVNIGTLYRLRFPFWILLLILGTSGIFEFFRLIQRNATKSMNPRIASDVTALR